MDKFWREMILVDRHLQKSDEKNMLSEAEMLEDYIKNGTSKVLPDKLLNYVMSVIKKDAILNDYYVTTKEVDKWKELQKVGNVTFPLGGGNNSGHSLEWQLYSKKLSGYKSKAYLEQ